MRKVVYISAIPFPNVWANSSQVIKTCESLKKSGLDIHLWAQGKDSPERIFSYYRVAEAFPLRLTPFKNKSERTVFSGHVFYSFRLLRMLRHEDKKPDVLYAREVMLWPVLLIAKIFYGIPFAFEAHRITQRTLYDGVARRMVLRGASAIVVISKALRQVVEKMYPRTPVVLAYCGVDPNRFRIEETKESVRAEFDIEQDRFIVMYVGSLQPYEGVDVLVRAAEGIISAHANVDVYIVGGFEDQIQRLKNLVSASQSSRIRFIPHVAYESVPRYLKAADVLVIPLLKDEPGASPVKMFEYLFCKKPIVASRLPAVEEVLIDGQNARLFAAGDIDALQNALEGMVSNTALCDALSDAAVEDAARFTFDERAKNIRRGIEIATDQKPV